MQEEAFYACRQADHLKQASDNNASLNCLVKSEMPVCDNARP